MKCWSCKADLISFNNIRTIYVAGKKQHVCIGCYDKMVFDIARRPNGKEWLINPDNYNNIRR